MRAEHSAQGPVQPEVGLDALRMPALPGEPPPRPIDRRSLPAEEEAQRRDAAAAIEKTMGFSPITARCLAARGFAPGEALDRYLDPSIPLALGDIWKLKGLDRACDLLADAIRQKRTIIICHDFDVDGAMSAAMMVRFLRGAGAAVKHSGSRRFSGGYGITAARVEELARESPGALLLCLDFGTAAHQPLSSAKELGFGVIVVDHHEPGAGELPPADALINPRQPGCGYAAGRLCTGGLAYVLITALADRLGLDSDRRGCLPYALFATISDVVPLDGLNRAICREGLFEARRCLDAGVEALRRVSGKSRGKLKGEDIAFGIGPRINAAGRLEDRGADLIVDMATASEREHAQELALEVNAQNAERRRIERRDLTAALDTAERIIGERGGLPAAFVIADASFHAGVAGIVAARIKDRYNRPAFVFSWNAEKRAWVGSARGIEAEAVSISAALFDERVRRHHEKPGAKAGGHPKAGGATVLEADFAAFAADFEAVIAEQMRGKDITPRVSCDCAAAISELNRGGVKLLDEFYDVFEPCGAGNPAPRLLIRNAAVTAVRGIAPDGGTQPRHLLARLREDAPGSNPQERFIDAVLWFGTSHPALKPGQRVDLVVELKRDDRGAEYHPAAQKLRLSILAVEPAGG